MWIASGSCIEHICSFDECHALDDSCDLEAVLLFLFVSYDLLGKKHKPRTP